MDSLQDILGKLTDEDIASLQAAADAMFGGSASEESQPQEQNKENDLFGGINPAMLQKLSGLMGKMNRKDSRTDLLFALKPHLSPERRKRADEAVQLLRLMELMPTLQQTMRDEQERPSQ